MSDLITRARKEWCGPQNYDVLDSTVVLNYGPRRCPPEVVAALLDVLQESHEYGYGPDGEPQCVICAGEYRVTGLHSWAFNHATSCALAKAEAAIAKALEERA